MIARGLSLLTVLSSCVLSLPVTSSQLENVDVDVMKCIVEALADVLSRPHVMPVSQECLITLKTDDRLVAILRHHNFLRELQEIAFQGDQERAKLQGSDVIAPKTKSLQTADDSDQSMLEALGGPGERSILSQRKRTENGDGRAEKDESREDGESQEDGKAVEVKRGKEVQDGTEKREEEADEEERENSEELSKEKKSMDKKGDGLDEERDASRNKSKQRESEEQNEEEETEKTSPPFSQQHIGKEEEEEEREESKRGSSESLKQWAKRAEFLHLKKKAVGKETQQLASQNEVPHHSKEVMVEEMEEEKKKKRGVQRSPEEKELQMIARRVPEERRGIEEEGSASRKSEEPDIESLAAIESELENVAQKLHELRQG